MIFGYFGIIGSGKTLSAVIHAYREYKKGETVYSTMPLSFPHEPLSDVDDFYNAKDGIILGDELWFLLDSRYSTSKVNNVMASILLRSRKQMLDILYTEQYVKQIDIRIRRNTQFFVQSQIEPYFRKIDDSKKYVENGGHYYLTQEIYDMDGVLQDRHFFDNVEKFFALYNTSDDPYIDQKHSHRKSKKSKKGKR